MNQTKKILSEAGKKGARIRKEKKELRRNELFDELRKYTNKFWLDVIQFSRRRWTNEEIEELIYDIKNETKK